MVKVYSDPNLFWKETSPQLLKDEAKHSLCLGLAFLFQKQPEDCVYQSALFEGDQLLGAIVVSRFKTNTNFLPTQIATPAAAQALFEEFMKADIYATGIVGDLQTAMEYKKLFIADGRKIKVNMTQGIYRCRKVKLPRTANYLHFRQAELSDVPAIGPWVEQFHKEAVPHDPPVNGAQHAESKIKGECFYVLEKDGTLLSMAGLSRDIGTSCSVNFVYTPKDLRKNGYASVVTARLTQHLLDRGRTETNLYADATNPTSNKIYQDIGYEFVCDSIHYGIEG